MDGKGVRESTKLREWGALWMEKGVRGSMELREWDDLWNGKLSGSPRNWEKWMLWRRVSLVRVNEVYENG